MVFESAWGAVTRLRSGEISVREAVLAQLELLHDCDRATHAVAWFDDERAEREAERLDTLFFRDRNAIGPLHGLPITVKDWIDVEGLPCAGDTDQRDRRPTTDATVVRRLRDAGAIVIAKTKAWGPDAAETGAVRHPTHDDRMPGGSSTGESVAIVSGGSIVGIGSDSGGSIRLPAARRGVTGFKPTTGLVPSTGHFPRAGRSLRRTHADRTDRPVAGRCRTAAVGDGRCRRPRHRCASGRVAVVRARVGRGAHLRRGDR